MVLINPQIPTVGQPVGGEEVDATAALQQLVNLVNGMLEADNLSLATRSRLNPPVVTSLPPSPVDGDRVLFNFQPSVNRLIELRYVAAMTGPYKWVPIGGGGGSIGYQATGSAAIPTGTSVTLTTVGGSVALPLAGDYRAQGTARVSAGDSPTFVGPANVTGPVILSAPSVAYTGQDDTVPVDTAFTVAAPTTVALGFQRAVGGSTPGSVADPRLFVTPLRVG